VPASTHKISAALLTRPVRVLVIGCGGNGSAIIGGLPYLHQAMIAAGHPGGLRVTVMDHDTVSAVNCVRQPFSESEVGLFKAVVLVNRINPQGRSQLCRVRPESGQIEPLDVEVYGRT